MEVNDALVEKIAHLARLHIEDADKEAARRNLQRMISFVEKLNELDTRGVEPLLHISDNINIFRADHVQGSINRQEGLKNAELHDGEFFKVPKVITRSK